MREIAAYIDACYRHHAHAWIAHLELDQRRQFALDLIRHALASWSHVCHLVPCCVSQYCDALKRTSDLGCFVHFDFVADAHIRIVFHTDTTFDAVLNLIRVVFKAAQ